MSENGELSIRYRVREMETRVEVGSRGRDRVEGRESWF